jgi:hypothetical protein
LKLRRKIRFEVQQRNNTPMESYRMYEWVFWKWYLSFLWRSDVLRDHLRATRISDECVRVVLMGGWTICGKLSDDHSVAYASVGCGNVIGQLMAKFAKERVACGTKDHSWKLL